MVTSQTGGSPARFPTVTGRSLLGVELALPHDFPAERTLAVKGVFLLIGGGAPTTSFLGGALPLGEGGCLMIDHEQGTAISGVFAAGDVTCEHVKQAVVAAAEGVIAALPVDKYLNRGKRIKVDYK